ncbi:uncharacterized protein LOC108100035 [Drosophila ficusphila]|uniref:uncharacterized protein LOC108100035 n=1 Tax=Drosophila ficusphila TaxID=30025 RepID=UPI0007E6B84F|nr:uncharacterized protein LOC108100035 [Drosophila ficusphila]
MSEKDRNKAPEQLDDETSEDDSGLANLENRQSIDTNAISISPSILRPINTPRPDLSNAPSVVLSLPEDSGVSEETPEQRQRRRMRFLELRREHYNNMHSEQCHMADYDDEDHAKEQPPTEEKTKPK